MGVIGRIRAKIQQGRFEFSQHATDRAIIRDIRVRELREAMQEAELVESYPEDKYGPSYLVLGFTDSGRPLHVHCSHPSRPLIKIITLYEPSPSIWVDFKYRRNTHE